MILAENSSVLDLTTLPTMAAAGKVKLKNETTIFQKAYYDQSRYICRLRHYDLLIAIRRGQRPLLTVSNKDPTVQKDNVQRKLSSGYVNRD